MSLMPTHADRLRGVYTGRRTMPQGRAAPTLVMAVVTMALGCGYRDTVSAAPTPQVPSATRTIVAFGDSLTSGRGLPLEQAFPAVLERRLRAQGLPFRVVNHGVSGDTTTDGVRRVKAALAEQPEILILALGANDGLRGVLIRGSRPRLVALAAVALRILIRLCGNVCAWVVNFTVYESESSKANAAGTRRLEGPDSLQMSQVFWPAFKTSRPHGVRAKRHCPSEAEPHHHMLGGLRRSLAR
jgi:hypothetical protein